MLGLEALIESAKDLEPLPASATRLAAVVSRSDVELKEILEVVSLDQALTARLLRVANSAASASKSPVKTVKDAIVRLGNATVLALAVAGAVGRQMRTALPVLGFAEDQLWRHSVATALASERMKKFCKKSIPPEAFTAALLHDIGKLVLVRFVSPDTATLLSRAQNEGKLRRLQAELELIGAHHAELGGLISQRWGLPERLGRAIQYHHSPEEYTDVVSDAVAVANQAARLLELAPVEDDPHPDDISCSRERLGISEEGFKQICQQLSTDFEETLNRFA